MAAPVERSDEYARRAMAARAAADQTSDPSIAGMAAEWARLADEAPLRPASGADSEVAAPAWRARQAARSARMLERLENLRRRVRIAAFLAAEASMDFALQIQARGLWQRPSLAVRNTPSEPLPHVAIGSILGRLSLNEEDVVCDLGCGTGRMLCWLARQRVKLCLGVERDEGLAAIARANLAGFRRLRSPVEIRVEDAAETDLSGVTVLFLRNRFGAEALRAVLTNLRASAASRPGRLVIIYSAPANLTVFDEFPEFRVVDRLVSPSYDGTIETVFLRSAPATYWAPANSPA
jgi:protein-L-isoaspartate O-methyltransferase